MRSSICIVGFALILAALAGCLTSKTESFEYQAIERIDPAVLNGAASAIYELDLAENDSYEANEQHIHRIDRVGFEARVLNASGAPAHFDISVRTDTTAAFVPVLTGVAVSGAPVSFVPFEETEPRVNLPEIERAIRAGQFELELRTGNGSANLTIEELTLVVIFSVSI